MEEFLRDAEARSLKEKTIYKYRLLFRQLEKFAELKGIHFLQGLDTPALRQYRGTWKDGNLASLKKLERLRAFFRFACGSKWIVENPVTELKNPKVSVQATMPYTHDEMVQILWCAAGLAKLAALQGRRTRAVCVRSFCYSVTAGCESMTQSAAHPNG